MNNYSIIDSIEYSNKSFFLHIADQGLTPLRVMCNGRHIRLDEETSEIEHVTHDVALRIFAGLLVLATLPVTLIALAVKWWKREEWQQVVLEHLEQKEFELEIQEDKKEIVVPEEQEDFIEFIQQELAQVHELDKKLPPPIPHSWRKYGAEHGETNETLTDYIKARLEDVSPTWPNRHPLYIQCMGTFSETDLKIASITADYLRVFHNVPVKLCKNILSVEQLKDKYLEMVKEKREQSLKEGKAPSGYMWENYIEKLFPRANGQYNTDVAIELMKSVLIPDLEKEAQEEVQLVIFTSEDLYSFGLDNFVFGSAALFDRVGIWSNARFGDPNSSSKAFEKCLLRMMKISAHEFGHMRHLSHCTDYECNIGGYMSLPELDSRPLLYCLQDTAKLCYLTHASLLEHEQKVLEFYQNFNKAYALNCDFSKEIQVLQKRIRYLKKLE